MKKAKDEKPFKVAFVSTFPPTREGIAKYSFSLVNALNDLDKIQIIVLSNRRYPENNSNLYVLKAWTRNSIRYILSIPWMAAKLKVNLVHIQHEYLLYGKPFYSGLFPFILFFLRLLRKKIVITMHSVILREYLTANFFETYSAGRKMLLPKRLSTLCVTKFMGLLAHAIIVHYETAKKELAINCKINPSKIYVIPHGVEIIDAKLDSNSAKKKLGFQGTILFYFGLIRLGRGLEYAVKALGIIIKEFPDVKLIIAGRPHPFSTFKASDYIHDLKHLVEKSNLEKNVIFISRYIPEHELSEFLSAADIFVLPYTENGIIGASGVLSKILGYGKPIVITKVYRFSDFWNTKSLLLVKPNDAGSLAYAVIKLIKQPFAKANCKSLSKLAKESSWSNVAKKTLSLYCKVFSEVKDRLAKRNPKTYISCS